MLRLEDRPLWIIRTYSGFGDADQSNRRFRENLAKGQGGLSVAFDLPTQTGYDSDHPMSTGEVGGTGVAVDHLGDMDRLLAGIDLGRINTSMTINATAPWLFAMYVALADQRGVARETLRGTVQNDLLKEFVGRGTYVLGPTASLRLTTDLIVFSAERVPKWNPINACGYHYMESGACPAEEVGFALGNALMILDAIRPRLSDDGFENVVRRISFFVNSGLELVPELAKFRAYAQLWPALCESEYGVGGVRFRAGCQVRSLTLTEQQPEVNIVRIAYQALPAVLSAGSRVRALQLPGFREAQGLPDAAEQALSLRTQQVLMYETGLADYPDIFDGSTVIEKATADLKEEALAIVAELREVGYENAIDFISRRLTAGLVTQQAALEAGDIIRVGVNAFLDPIGLTEPPSYEEDTAARKEAVERQLERLRAWKSERDATAVAEAREKLAQAVPSGANIVDASIELAKAGGTTGEWTATLEDAFGGRYSAPLGLDVTVSQSPKVPRVTHPVRILIAKGGLDGHINAVKVLAYACREAGMEVIYSGLHQPPQAIAASAIQEDVDLIGVSSLAGAHLYIVETLLAELEQAGAGDIPVVIGGIIPDDDGRRMKALGVAEVFTPKDGDIGAIVARLIDIAG